MPASLDGIGAAQSKRRHKRFVSGTTRHLLPSPALTAISNGLMPQPVHGSASCSVITGSQLGSIPFLGSDGMPLVDVLMNSTSDADV